MQIMCPYCHKLMRVEDEDKMFKGCVDVWWECDNCKKISAISKIRYGKICKITFDGRKDKNSESKTIRVYTGENLKRFLEWNDKMIKENNL